MNEVNGGLKKTTDCPALERGPSVDASAPQWDIDARPVNGGGSASAVGAVAVDLLAIWKLAVDVQVDVELLST